MPNLSAVECVNHKVQAYAEQHSEAASALLVKIQQETQAHIPGSQMLAGHLQGRLLATFANLLRPQKILELGTFTGYSTLCLAEGLQPSGLIYTIDKNTALATKVRGYFEQSGKASQIRYHLGLAADIIPQLDEVFDLVYMDADKKNYQHYYELVFDKVRSGGLIIADNVLWGGKVLPHDGTFSTDKITQAIRAFNIRIHQDPRVENVLLPIRDGLMMVRKK